MYKKPPSYAEQRFLYRGKPPSRREQPFQGLQRLRAVAEEGFAVCGFIRAGRGNGKWSHFFTFHNNRFFMMATNQPVLFDAARPSYQKFLSDTHQRWKMQWFLFQKLPAAWFMGLRVRRVTAETGEVELPFGWRSQNPFRSIYFAAQLAAAEFSTGILALSLMAGTPAKFSMLIIRIESKFVKKATTRTTFTCTEGAKILTALAQCYASRQPQTVTLTSIGRDLAGNVVSETVVEWSFLLKEPK